MPSNEEVYCRLVFPNFGICLIRKSNYNTYLLISNIIAAFESNAIFRKQKARTMIAPFFSDLRYSTWSEWSTWSECRGMCGSGNRTSTRRCLTDGAEACIGSSSRTEACHPKSQHHHNHCPSMYSIHFYLDIRLN